MREIGGIFGLDRRLAADSDPVCELRLCSLRLMKDASFPWLLLVPRRADLVELYDLNAADQARLMSEIARVSMVLRELTNCDKINVASLGNMVPQLHVHIIARFSDDPAWPGPVWGRVPPRGYDEETRRRLIGALREHLE